MKPNNRLESISLRKVFAIIFILVAFIPILVASGLTASFLKIENQSKLENELKFQNQVKFSLVTSLKSIRSDVEILAQNNAFIDFVMAPPELRLYTENRLFGLTNEVNVLSQYKPSYLVFDGDRKRIFENPAGRALEAGADEQFDLRPGYHYIPASDLVYFTKEIKYDDQQLQGPSAKLKGYLVGIVYFKELKSHIPGLGHLIKFDPDLEMSNLEIEINASKSVNGFSIGSYILISFCFLILAIGAGLYFFNRSILKPIYIITKNILSEANAEKFKKSANEIQILEQAINTYRDNLKKNQDELIRQSQLSALHGLAAQVAHDIRSPLTALNMVIGTSDQLPEEKRLIIRAAIQRINDIANELLSKGKESSSSRKKRDEKGVSTEQSLVVMLSSLVDSLVSEKRSQFRDKMGVQIDVDMTKSYGLFSNVPPNEFNRVLSNCINNSVEALTNETGRIFVRLDESEGMIRLEIWDNGRGIPQEVIGRLGLKGISIGKEGTQSGSGLGIYHAKKVVEAAGGKMIFESGPTVQNRSPSFFSANTTVTILLPKAKPPAWFVDHLEIKRGATIVVLDDDQSIHNIWSGRLKSLGASESDIELMSFTSAEAFKKWFVGPSSKVSNVIYLIDYELLGQQVTGLDVIEELSIQNSSILVTSRHEEKYIIERCHRLSLRMIPKMIAGLIPLKVSE